MCLRVGACEWYVISHGALADARKRLGEGLIPNHNPNPKPNP